MYEYKFLFCRAYWLNAPGLALFGALCSFCGLIVYSHYKFCDPLTTGVVTGKDQVWRPLSFSLWPQPLPPPSPLTSLPPPPPPPQPSALLSLPPTPLPFSKDTNFLPVTIPLAPPSPLFPPLKHLYSLLSMSLPVPTVIVSV